MDKGIVRHIGASNFNAQLLNDLFSYARVTCACVQVELHVYFQQVSLIEWIRSHGVVVVAYSPLAAPGLPKQSSFHRPQHPPLLHNPDVLSIASALHCSAAQVVLAYLLHEGMVVIPKASSQPRLAENLKSIDVERLGRPRLQAG